jgi:predicted ATP-dependent endonuclease of OLD family
MDSVTLKQLYDKACKGKYGCEYFKMDLHIHTPSSKCYKKTYTSNEEEYIKILDEAFENGIGIIAITDHNTVKGYYEMMDYIMADKKKYSKYTGMLILPGIEISSFGKHILAIFPPQKTQDELNTFLYNIGIDINEQGEEDADAYKVTPMELMKRIYEMDGITILAHADSTNGMLEKLLHNGNSGDDSWIHKGKSLASIIKSEHLYGISLNDKGLKDKLLKDILNNKEYRREKSIAVIYCSDSHGTRDTKAKYKADGKPIGERYSYIKLSELSFHGLKIALLDPEVRIYDEIPGNIYPYIEGVAINGGYLEDPKNPDGFQFFRFNKALNCVIGARGTGKSTLLDTVQYTLFPEVTDDEVALKFDISAVFLNYFGDVYAFICEPKIEFDNYTKELIGVRNKPSIYKLSKNGKFYSSRKSNEIYKELQNFSSVAYKQRAILNYAQDKRGPIDVINNLLLISNTEKYSNLLKGIKQNYDSIESILKKQNRVEWNDYIERAHIVEEDMQEITCPFLEILESNKQIFNLRKNIIKKVNKILDGQVRLRLEKDFAEKDKKRIIDDTVNQCRRKFNIIYEKQILLEKWLTQVVRKVALENAEWIFPVYVLYNKPNKLAKCYGLEESDAEQLIKWVRPVLDRWVFTTFPEDKIEYEYNVNTGISKKQRFLPRNMLSMGQKSVAMLLMIVTAAHDLGDNRPLIIDQPEDDLDNIYIYSSLVKEFRKIKNSRQLIFATHNPNIPISGDAENIIILESTGENGYVSCSGSIDKVGISEKVLNILEGGRQALDVRNMKYPPFK